MIGGGQQWLVASGGALWALVFLTGQRQAALMVAPLVLVCLLALRAAPLAAGLALAGVTFAAGTWLEVPAANPALLVPGLVAVYAAGRRVARWWGLLVVAGFALTGWWVDDMSVPSGMFALFVFGGTWLFGTLVRRRTESARAARRRATALGSEDLAAITRDAVVVERAQLAGSAIEVLRAAVVRMRADAAQAARGLDPDALERIHTDGAAAVAELRGLLDLLRSTPEVANGAPDDPVGPDGPVTGNRRPWQDRPFWLMDGVAAVTAGLLTVLDRLNSQEPPDVLALVAGLVPCAALLLRRRRLATAIALAALPVALVLGFGMHMVDGFGDILVIGLLGWSVAGSTQRWPWVAYTALAALHLGWAWGEHSGNLPITAVVLALPLLAGHAWAERDREAAAAQAESRSLQDHRDTQITQALGRERLRIARELHDVASHAIGVMVLQAGAAQALRLTAPTRARESLRTVETAGTQALSELAVLRKVLAGPDEPGALPGAGEVVAFADRLRAAGTAVDLRLDDLPPTGELAVTASRIVLEALTNAARYAPGARVSVQVIREGDDLVIDVVDDGPGDGGSVGAMGTGHGLLGLDERVRLLRGEFAAGPIATGGFRVCARIPDPPRAHDGSAEPMASVAPAEPALISEPAGTRHPDAATRQVGR